MQALLREIGLTRCPPFHRDPWFWSLVAGGVLVAWGLHLFGFAAPLPAGALTAGLVVSFVLWQPLLEELLFRGVIQGRLLQSGWGARRRGALSIANTLTSLAFALLHLVHQPPIWAASIFVPSLAFGLIRERHASLYPALALHGLYNLFFLLARAA